MKLRNELNALATIAFRDVLKLFRDRVRLLASLIFPLIFIGILGNSLQSNVGDQAGYNFIVFTFTGVVAQVLFQSTAGGIMSLVEDRENDFAQELFIAPVSRYTILIGKIIGETLVSLVQGIAVVIFSIIIGVPMTVEQLLILFPAMVIAAIFGGGFGILILTNLNSQRTAAQLFPFLMFPQYILAGVFTPIKSLPPLLIVLSKISPMTYAVDFMRNLFYAGSPEYDLVVLHSPAVNLTVIIILTLVFIIVGSYFFVRNETNR